MTVSMIRSRTRTSLLQKRMEGRKTLIKFGTGYWFDSTEGRMEAVGAGVCSVDTLVTETSDTRSE